MKIWLIKNKGKNWVMNMEMSHTVEIGKDKFWCQLCFYRKKDAVKYLKNKFKGEDYEKFLLECREVVWAELQESKIDNRKK